MHLRLKDVLNIYPFELQNELKLIILEYAGLVFCGRTSLQWTLFV